MADIFLKDLKKEVAEDTGYSQDQVEHILRSFFDKTTAHLAAKDKVYLINFVNFDTTEIGAKHTVHPKTGEDMTIPPYLQVNCKPTESFKGKLKDALQ